MSRKKRFTKSVYVSTYIDVDVEIDLMEHIEGMDKSDLVALYNAIAAQIGQSVIADDSDQPIGINVEIGRREIGRLINDRWNSLSHHAQAVASAMGY